MSEAVVILGPTASGKSALALSVAQHYQSEVISLDSALVYKGMDIGTAKPTPQELATCPHHLIDICDPQNSYSAASFRDDCIKLVPHILSRNAMPIICGGTMMYYKALVDGLSPLPPTEDAIRERVLKEADEIGWVNMHAKLEQFDKVLFQKLAPNDKQRISRAIEVYYMTGRAMSSFFDEKKDACPFGRLEIVLLPKNNDRTELRAVIRQRLVKMIDEGLIDEARVLKERGLDYNLPALRSVGYRQALMYLDGEVDKEQMLELAVNATSKLAKHQMTWLRGGLNAHNSIELNDENYDLLCSDKLYVDGQKVDLHVEQGKSLRFYLEIEDKHKIEKTLRLISLSSFAKYKK